MRDIFATYKIFDLDLYQLRSRNFHAAMIADRKVVFERLSACLKKSEDFCCPLCGSSDKDHYLSWSEYHLFECNACGAVSPNIAYEKLHDVNYHSQEIVKSDIKREIIATYDYRKNKFGSDRFQYLKSLIPGFGETRDFVLDVGCGPGYFLSYLSDHDVPGRGLEVNPFCVDFCKESGIDVGSNLLAAEPDDTYSLITMFDVLEHLEDPIAVFSDANSKLRAGGYLLAYTPNIHSVSSHLMHGEHNMIAVFNHLCFYDQKSLSRLADKSGFEIVNCDFYGLDLMDYLAMKESEHGIPYFEHLRPMVGPLQALIDANKLGNCMRVLFKKL